MTSSDDILRCLYAKAKHQGIGVSDEVYAIIKTKERLDDERLNQDIVRETIFLLTAMAELEIYPSLSEDVKRLAAAISSAGKSSLFSSEGGQP